MLLLEVIYLRHSGKGEKRPEKFIRLAMGERLGV
jgi:hypothetical protein